MSHIVSIQTKVQDLAAIQAACHRLKLPMPVEGTAKLYSGQAKGLLLQLPGWQYPVVIDTATGNTNFDNYNGAWGEQQKLDAFLQTYAVEKAKIEARKKNLTVYEKQLQDGSIQLQIQEGY